MKIMIPALLLLLASASRAADLKAVVSAAVARSPAAAEARARKSQARAAGREAFWSRWPRLSARGTLARSDDPLFVFGELLQERIVTQGDFNPDTLNHPGYRTAGRGSLELGMPLFTGFELTRAGRLAVIKEDLADILGGAAAQAVRLRAAQDFLNDLRLRALVAELDARIASSASEIAAAERLRKQGLVLGSDHQAALALLSGLKAWRARAAAERAAAEAELSVLAGGIVEPSGALSAWTPPLEDDQTLVSAALAQRSDVRAADAGRREASLHADAAAWSMRPEIDAFAALDTAADGLSSGAASRLVGVRASLPFGDPAYLSRRAGAKAEGEAAQAARAQAEDAARAEVLARAAGLRGLVQSLPDLDESFDRASRSLEEVRPLYREGRQSVLEVLRAEEAAAKLVDARLEALSRLRSDWAALRAAQGLLDDEAVSVLSRSLGTP